MFSNYNIVLHNDISSGQMKIFENFIKTNNGSVVVKKNVPLMFQNSIKQMSFDKFTYICTNVQDISKLSKYYDSNNCNIVSTNWISQCIKSNSIVDLNPYLLSPTTEEIGFNRSQHIRKRSHEEFESSGSGSALDLIFSTNPKLEVEYGNVKKKPNSAKLNLSRLKTELISPIAQAPATVQNQTGMIHGGGNNNPFSSKVHPIVGKQSMCATPHNQRLLTHYKYKNIIVSAAFHKPTLLPFERCSKFNKGVNPTALHPAANHPTKLETTALFVDPLIPPLPIDSSSVNTTSDLAKSSSVNPNDQGHHSNGNNGIAFDAWNMLDDDAGMTKFYSLRSSESISNAGDKGVAKPYSHIVAFDLDGTLIVTKSGKTFSTHSFDWKFIYNRDKMFQVLNDPIDFDGMDEDTGAAVEYKPYFMIITNQSGVRNGKTDIKSIQVKIDQIIEQLLNGVDRNVEGVSQLFECNKNNSKRNLDGESKSGTKDDQYRSNIDGIDVFVAFNDDLYRKPRCLSWHYMVNKRSLHHISPLNCIYVGDAAGRLKNATRNADFAATDYKFSLNLGVQFRTPERFFLNDKSVYHNPQMCQVPTLNTSTSPTTSPTPTTGFFRLMDMVKSGFSGNNNMRGDFLCMEDLLSSFTGGTTQQEVIVLCGPVASGKSTLCHAIVEHMSILNRTCIRVNQDILKTASACVDAARMALENGHSVCIDNTNLTKEVRGTWLKLAQEYSVKARCIVIDIEKPISMTLALYRYLNPKTTDRERRMIKDVTVHTHYKYIRHPSDDEGFDEIIRYPFHIEIESCPQPCVGISRDSNDCGDSECKLVNNEDPITEVSDAERSNIIAYHLFHWYLK